MEIPLRTCLYIGLFSVLSSTTHIGKQVALLSGDFYPNSYSNSQKLAYITGNNKAFQLNTNYPLAESPVYIVQV